MVELYEVLALSSFRNDDFIEINTNYGIIQFYVKNASNNGYYYLIGGSLKRFINVNNKLHNELISIQGKLKNYYDSLECFYKSLPAEKRKFNFVKHDYIYLKLFNFKKYKDFSDLEKIHKYIVENI